MSNEMNPWLASVYGTDGADDIEKTAQSHLLMKIAEENNLDLSQFSPQELQELLVEVLGPEGAAQAAGQVGGPQVNTQSPQSQGFAPGTDMNPTQMNQQRPGTHPSMAQAFAPAAQPQVPQGMAPGAMQQGGQQQGADPSSLQKEAAAKFEEADFLGRVMAHAYTQELEKIASTKTAGRMDGAKGAFNSAKNRAGHAAERFGAKAKSKATEYGMKARHHKGAIAAGAAGLAAGEVHGRMSKKASAFEKLAEINAAEILGASGFDPATGQDMANQQQDQGQQYQQNQQSQQGIDQNQGQMSGVEQGPQQNQEGFAEALDTRSLEMLSEAGYDVNEILARLQLAQQQNPGQA